MPSTQSVIRHATANAICQIYQWYNEDVAPHKACDWEPIDLALELRNSTS